MKKYSIYNQITGNPEEALSYEDALVLQKKIQQDWLDWNKELFTITVLVENLDGSWTQSISDDSGNPIIREEQQNAGSN